MHSFIYKISTLGLLALAALAPANAANISNSTSNLSRRLVNGGTMSSEGYDYIVYVGAGNTRSSIEGCTGVLIAPKYVLTTQNCLNKPSDGGELNGNGMSVTIGTTNGNSGKRKTTEISVANAYPGSQFPPAGHYNHIALLELSKEVPSNVATPVKIYAGEYSPDLPARLVGYLSESTQDSPVGLDNMMVQNLALDSKDYCSDANKNINSDTEFCSRLTMARLNTCRVDLGTPVLTPVAIPKLSSSNDKNKDGGEDMVSYALLGLTTYSYKNAAYELVCVYGGEMGFYTWIYPFISKIASLTSIDESEFLIANVTESPEPSSSSTSSSTSSTSSKTKTSKTSTSTSSEEDSSSEVVDEDDNNNNNEDDNGGVATEGVDPYPILSAMVFTPNGGSSLGRKAGGAAVAAISFCAASVAALLL